MSKEPIKTIFAEQWEEAVLNGHGYNGTSLPQPHNIDSWEIEEGEKKQIDALKNLVQEINKEHGFSASIIESPVESSTIDRFSRYGLALELGYEKTKIIIPFACSSFDPKLLSHEYKFFHDARDKSLDKDITGYTTFRNSYFEDLVRGHEGYHFLYYDLTQELPLDRVKQALLFALSSEIIENMEKEARLKLLQPRSRLEP